MNLTSPPFAPKTLHTLQAIGIATQDDLRAHGAVAVFLLLKASGLTVTRSTLWQLEAACRGINVEDLHQANRTALLEAVRTHPPVDVFPAPSAMENHMRQALQQAEQSASLGEVPVGAVVVHDNRIIAAAHNTCVSSHNISRHAEIAALAAAGAVLGNYRLDTCDVYITLEPCTMCASALIQARIRRVIYGAPEPKSGAAGSVLNLFADIRLNRHTAVAGGILAPECRAVLQRFFQNRR